jgi:hypothetical protein
MNKLIVAALAAALVPQSASAALIGLYRFNDATNLGFDSSGANNHAVNAGVTFAAAGHQGGAASFQSAAYLTAPINAAATVLPQFTWGAWVKPAAGGGSQQAVLSTDNGGYDRQLMIDSRSGTSWASLTGSGVLSSGVGPSTSEWTFLAGVYDNAAKSMTLYVNGQSFTGVTSFGSSRDTVTIGRNPSFDERFFGLVDNVFIFDEALSAERIEGIRATGFPVSGVPEPTTWAMLVAGFGFIGMTMRRRNAMAATA